MSWKNVKTHYQIKHIVQVREGLICVGSPYVSDLLKVSPDGSVTWGALGPSGNDDLARYYAEMTADPQKLRDLIALPDTFESALPVFTYKGGDIIEKQCEAYDWPNVTHDGDVMYENTYSQDRDKVVRWAKENAAAGVRRQDRRIGELREQIAEAEKRRDKDAADLAKLDASYPGIEKEGAL